MFDFSTAEYTLIGREFYETLDAYVANSSDFICHAQRLLPTWQLAQSGFWFNCVPPKYEWRISQGWKIHVSTTLTEAVVLFTVVARLMAAHDTPFKFVSDKFLLGIQGGKQWNRGGSGKFITIYPSTEEDFKRLIELLHRATVGYSGPYILSDKRYKNSKVIYYRYGGFTRHTSVDHTGLSKLLITSPEGALLNDERNPFFSPPDWALDPFKSAEAEAEDVAETGDAEPESTLCNGRYVIQEALAMSNTGGVYLALDNVSQAQVVIKEARPCTNCTAFGTDAVTMLRKERRLLELLEDTGLVAKVIDFFQDWEHFYLVQSYLPGNILRLQMGIGSLALDVAPTLASVRHFFDRYASIYGAIAKAIIALHSRGVIFQDWSHYNVIVAPDDSRIWLIDFEGAIEVDVDVFIPHFTTGFSEEYSARVWPIPTRAHDAFGLGSLMFAGLMPVNGLLALSRETGIAYLRQIVLDLGLPPCVGILSEALLNLDSTSAIDPNNLLNAVGAMDESVDQCRLPKVVTQPLSPIFLNEHIVKIVDHIYASATPSRIDRCFPSAPELFTTNGINVAYGASGVVMALNRIKGVPIPNSVLDWIDSHRVDPNRVPPGLYTGMAGIAWSLLEIGDLDRSTTMLRACAQHPLLRTSCDVFNGLAGVGLAQLHFASTLLSGEFLDAAIRSGDILLQLAKRSGQLISWPDENETSYGLCHGASGVGLFLLYLHIATGSTQYLEAAKEALHYDIQNGSKPTVSHTSFSVSTRYEVSVPYWRWGSAGIASVLARFKFALGTTDYDGLIEDILPDISRKFAIFPGRLFGLAGLGEALLDLYQFSGNERYKELAHRVASGVTLFGVPKPSGIAYPGEELMRFSCDYGTGSAGIALFLHRLLHGSHAPLLPDILFGPMCDGKFQNSINVSN